MVQDTLPQRLREQHLKWGEDRAAIRYKDYGLWNAVTWRAYYDHVKDFALGLKSLGFDRGEHVSIIGNNEPEWVYAELAVQALGGAVIGIYQDSTPPEVATILERSDSVYVVAEDQEQVDKLLEIKGEMPLIRKVVYWDPKGMRQYRDPVLIGFQEVQNLGREYEDAHPEFFEDEVERGKPDDIAVILTTSGTTSLPKLAMLSHANMLEMAENLLVKTDPMHPADEFVSALPLAWVGEQMMAVSGAMRIGFTVNFPEEPTTVQEDIRQIAPHVMFSPPRVWEGILSTIQVKIQDSSRLKRLVYRTFMAAAYKVTDSEFQHRKPGLKGRILQRLGRLLLFRVLKDRIGMSRIRTAYTGGAALGPDVFRFYHAIGVNLKQIYGQTEISGISMVHKDGEIKFETVGCPLPSTELKISPEGEILSKSPCVFQGYYKDPEATAEALKGGWLHSGDAGYVDPDGQLVVVDRMQDVMRLSDGSLFSPQYIENKLKFSPYIREAVIFGKGRPYVTAFVDTDFENLAKWAEGRQIPFTTYTDLSQKSEVYGLIRKEVERVNEQLPEAAGIRVFINLHKELDADDQELTRTRKVRRGFVEEKYTHLVDALYGEAGEVSVEAQVRYRDGREDVIQTTVTVERMGNKQAQVVSA